MDRRVRYEALQAEEEQETQPMTLTVILPPAPEGIDPPQQTESTAEMHKPGDTVMPPPYNVATDLPSYEEAERTKQQEIEMQAQMQQEHDHTSELDHLGDDSMQLGTDGMFLCTFIIAFLFNWIGLLASLCISNSVAGRFGGLAGFGLSLVKWAAIVRHNNWAGDFASTDSWLWWLLIVFGFLIFFRGCLQYIRIKYQWNRLSSHLRDRAYLLF